MLPSMSTVPPALNTQHLPMAARWSLLALGGTTGRYLSRPVDPVAKWILSQHPELTPLATDEVLGAIRSRTRLVDRMLTEEVGLARQDGSELALVVVGGGLDARWFRHLYRIDDVVTSYTEVELPEVLALKDALLADSPYSEPWSRIHQVPLPLRQWSVPPDTAGRRNLVLVEGLVDRVELNDLQFLLHRIRFEDPTARVLVEAPWRRQWSARHLRMLGWRVDEDLRLATCPALIAPGGHEVCSGVRAVRLQRLVPLV